MVPTSLPDGIPSGIVATRPSVPRVAMRSMLGLRAASSGVLPQGSLLGQSDMLTPGLFTYFKSLVLQDLEDLIYIRLDHDSVTEILEGGVRILEPMAGERAHDGRSGLEQSGAAVFEQ